MMKWIGTILAAGVLTASAAHAATFSGVETYDTYFADGSHFSDTLTIGVPDMNAVAGTITARFVDDETGLERRENLSEYAFRETYTRRSCGLISCSNRRYDWYTRNHLIYADTGESAHLSAGSSTRYGATKFLSGSYETSVSE